MWQLTIIAFTTNILLWTQEHHYQTAEACEKAAYQFVELGSTYVHCSTVRPSDCSDSTAGLAHCIGVGFNVGETAARD